MATKPPPAIKPEGSTGAEHSSTEDGFYVRHRKSILFITLVMCLAGAYAAYSMPSSVFPQTDFPRVVILIDNGVMPADEMMATITRPIEESMKDIPGAINVRSATGRGAAEVNVFFTWQTDMVQAELYVLGRLSQIRSTLPATATTAVHRLTFSAFPIIGISLTSETRSMTDLWQTARYDIKPRFLRIEGVARIALVGGDVPEFHVLVDPVKLTAYHLTLRQVSDALARTNKFVSAGMQEENHQLYLALVDGRVTKRAEIEEVVVSWEAGSPVLVRDVASVRPGAAPRFNIVTADGVDAVLLNVYAQPDGSTLSIARDLKRELSTLRAELPRDMRLAFFYDQSLFVREGVGSVWESIIIGLILSVLVLFAFLRTVATTLVTALAIPVTILVTLAGMHLFHMSFNLMTLGGIAAAIGMVIDDAIVIVESIYAKVCAGHAPRRAALLAVREVGWPLIGSTMTPVVVFLPMTYLDGVPGVFFRALAMTMVLALLTSLVLAVTLTPMLGSMMIRSKSGPVQGELEQGGAILRRFIGGYEWVVRRALRHVGVSAVAMVIVVAIGALLYSRLNTNFLPAQDEGAFVLDYFSRPGTSLAETDRILRHVEKILRSTPEVESYSRRTGARLALAIAEPNTGDFLVKLRSDRKRSTDEVVGELRRRVKSAEPALQAEFLGVLGDLIGDLTWSPNPIEIKIFTSDTKKLKQVARQIAEAIKTVPGVVDVIDGLIVAGPSLTFEVRRSDAARAGLDTEAIGSMLQTALLGSAKSYVLEGDRTVGVRVLLADNRQQRAADIGEIPMRTVSGPPVTLNEVTHIKHRPGLLERHREDLRELIAVSGRLAGRDLGTGIAAIKQKLSQTVVIPPDVSIEYGGLYQQQQESFRNLMLVLVTAILLVYGVLLIEFRSVLHPLAIVMGAVLAMFGVIAALWLTGTSLNIVSFLGAIIGVGIVAKNGILMLDFVDQLRARGLSLFESLVQSGRRRLRPVLMTSMTTFLGLLPLAYGVGAGADMLRPLAIAVIGALCISLLLSLVATPVCYYLLMRMFRLDGDGARGTAVVDVAAVPED